MNLAVDRRLFAGLVSCGMPGVSMSSAVDVGGAEISVETAAWAYAGRFAASGGVALERVARDALLP